MKKNADKNIDDLTSVDIRTFLTPHKSTKEKAFSGLSDETLAAFWNWFNVSFFSFRSFLRKEP